MNTTYTRIIAGLVISFLILFGFEAASEKNWSGEPGPLTHYHTLSDSLLRGELSLFPAPASILALKDPYDPAGNKALFEKENIWDLSLYKEKFYLYFGVVPALLFFLPFKILTGQHLPSAIMVYLCCSAALVLAALILFHVAKKEGAQKNFSFFAVIPPFLMLGLGGMAGILVKRAYMYEIAVASGMLFSTACLCALIREWGEPRRKWRILAGLCAGLAVGSRPNLLPGIAIVLGLTFLHVCSHLRREQVLAATVQLFAPFIAVGTALAAYNWLRFGSLTECGLHYQLGIMYAPRTSMAAWGYFIENFPAALFRPPVLRPNFPWLDISHEAISLLSGPPDILMFQRRVSLFVGLPFNLFAFYFLGKQIAARVRKGGDAAAVPSSYKGAFILPFAFACTTLTVLSFFLAAMPRYQADYALALVMAASIGWFEFWRDTARYSIPNIVMRCVSLLALLMSLYFGLILTHAVWA